MEIGSSDVRLIFDIFSPSNPRWRSSLSHCWRSNRGKGSGIGGVRELKGSSRVLVVEELRKPKLQRFLRGECLGFRTKIMPFLRQPPMRFGGSITGSIVDSEQPMILVLAQVAISFRSAEDYLQVPGVQGGGTQIFCKGKAVRSNRRLSTSPRSIVTWGTNLL
ncbi:unnamed protein product [Urochloa humidicola]